MHKTANRYRTASLFFFVSLILGGLSGCDRAAQYGVQQWGGGTMGTQYAITVHPVDAVRQQALQEGIAALLEQQVAIFSTYVDSSELSRFNAAAAPHCAQVSTDMAAVLTLAFRVHQSGDGAFDITVGQLVNRWGFGPAQPDDAPPNAAEIDAILASTGMQHLQWQAEERRLCKSVSVTLDLSAIAKGYAVDRIAELLAVEGVQNYLVDVGGELRVAGERAGGGSWRLAIEQPDVGAQTVHRIVQLREAAVATSGDYRNFREVDGQRFSHSIDPRTGEPVKHHIASVTVITKSSAEADAWATAMMVLDPQRTEVLAEQLSLPVYQIRYGERGDWEGWSSPAFAPYLQ